MKHFEFETFVGDDLAVQIPEEFAAEIERDRPVRVVVVIPDGAEQEQWAELTTQQFLQGYADTDGIYDDVSAG